MEGLVWERPNCETAGDTMAAPSGLSRWAGQLFWRWIIPKKDMAKKWATKGSATGGKLGDIGIYGQESNATTRRVVIMNLAIRVTDADTFPLSA